VGHLARVTARLGAVIRAVAASRRAETLPAARGRSCASQEQPRPLAHRAGNGEARRDEPEAAARKTPRETRDATCDEKDTYEKE